MYIILVLVHEYVQENALIPRVHEFLFCSQQHIKTMYTCTILVTVYLWLQNQIVNNLCTCLSNVYRMFFILVNVCACCIHSLKTACQNEQTCTHIVYTIEKSCPKSTLFIFESSTVVLWTRLENLVISLENSTHLTHTPKQ